MSVVFVVTPIIVGGWPVITAAAAAAAASLGYRQLESTIEPQQDETTTTATTEARSVELDIDNVEPLAEGLREDESLNFGDDRIRVTIGRDARGKVTVHADGDASNEELQEIGASFVHKLVQQYAYQKVASQLKDRGFSIVDEGVNDEQSIRIRFRKFE